MSKKIIKSILLFLLLLPGTILAAEKDGKPTDSLKGRILLQVEEHGEAWYVDPDSGKRAYLGRPNDALQVMGEYGLGVSNENLNKFTAKAPRTLGGKILLQVEDKGQGYYVDPVQLTLESLGSPLKAWQLMRNKGLGITNDDINKIPVADPTNKPLGSSQEQPRTSSVQADLSDQSLGVLEQAAFKEVNQYRASNGLPALVWNERIAETARKHCADMASGIVPFGHEGFESRFVELRSQLPITAMAENVAMNYGYSDPVGQAVNGWINSPRHEENMVGDYDISGMGVVKSSDGKIYFTQIFAR